MTWHFVRSEFALQLIEDMPTEAQFAFFDLLPHLEDHPDAVTEPYGLDVPGPVRMRSAALPGALLVFLVSDDDRTTSLVQVNAIP